MLLWYVMFCSVVVADRLQPSTAALFQLSASLTVLILVLYSLLPVQSKTMPEHGIFSVTLFNGEMRLHTVGVTKQPYRGSWWSIPICTAFVLRRSGETTKSC